MESTLIMIVLAVSSLTKAEVGPSDLPFNGCTVIDDHTVGGLRHPLNEKNFRSLFSKIGRGVLLKENLRRHI